MKMKTDEKIDYDSIPLSSEEVFDKQEGTFVCESHEVRDVISNSTGQSAGKKLFLKGKVKETAEVIEISQAIARQRNGVVREAGLWVKTIAGKLRIGTLVSMLTRYKIPTIGEVDGKEFEVKRNDKGYWVIYAGD